MPTDAIFPPGVASPNSWVAESNSPRTGRLRSGDAIDGIDLDALPTRKVDRDAAVAHGATGNPMPAALADTR